MKHPLSIIVAYARHNVIGKGNDLPWNIPEDLEHFRNTTKGSPVIMGRLTLDSILMRRNGKPLPGRPHYVISRQEPSFIPDGVRFFKTIDDAIKAAKSDYPEHEIFIIGGASVYAQSIDKVDKLYLTEIEATIDGGDAFFPNVDKSAWVETKREAFLDKPLPYTFLTLERR